MGVGEDGAGGNHGWGWRRGSKPQGPPHACEGSGGLRLNGEPRRRCSRAIPAGTLASPAAVSSFLFLFQAATVCRGAGGGSHRPLRRQIDPPAPPFAASGSSTPTGSESATRSRSATGTPTPSPTPTLTGVRPPGCCGSAPSPHSPPLAPGQYSVRRGVRAAGASLGSGPALAPTRGLGKASRRGLAIRSNGGYRILERVLLGRAPAS